MTLTEEDKQKYKDALVWALNAKVKEHLPADLKMLVESIEERVEKLRFESEVQTKNKCYGASIAFVKDFIKDSERL